MEKHYDVAVIGGGINGCGIAADASLRGLSVFLCDKNDLGSQTSANSTKLIHGGLRYLEHLEFSMVKKALHERSILLKSAPHLVKPMQLMLPHVKAMRPRWLLHLGLFLYDNLSRENQLPKSKRLKRKKEPPYFMPLKPALENGFLYSDCKTDDARLTLSNALLAKAQGAAIYPRTALKSAHFENGAWQLQVKPQNQKSYQITAKALINATGPWVDEVNLSLGLPSHHNMALVKGSHIVVNSLYEGEHAYLLQNDDKRVIFAIPYHGYTLIGTTDIELDEPLDAVTTSTEEIDYLIDAINQYFKRPINKKDIVESWSGVRPLLHSEQDKAHKLSRDYAFEFTLNPGPAVCVYGGKITTYRKLAVEAVNSLRKVFQDLPDSKTHQIKLPGSALGSLSLTQAKAQLKATYPWVNESLFRRYFDLYGTRMQLILQGKQSPQDLGIQFANTVFQAEIDYLIKYEWACTLEDILLRRTKLGLTMNDLEKQKLRKYLSGELRNSSVTH